jgi:hypothetical protein
MQRVEYDEFSMFHENAEEFGIPYPGPPVVRREFTDLGDGRQLSSLVWGEDPPELVFLHGGHRTRTPGTLWPSRLRAPVYASTCRATGIRTPVSTVL